MMIVSIIMLGVVSFAFLSRTIGSYNCVETPLNAIIAKDPQVIYAKGCAINSNDKSGFSAAVKAAESSDVAVVFVGIDNSIEVCS